METISSHDRGSVSFGGSSTPTTGHGSNSVSGVGSEFSWVKENSFDREAALQVQGFFQDIDSVLFDDGCPSKELPPRLNAECLEWSSRYLHLRSVGAQLLPEADQALGEVISTPEGFREGEEPECSFDPISWAGPDVDALQVVAHAACVHDGADTPASEHEEVFAEHGELEECFAYDSDVLDAVHGAIGGDDLSDGASADLCAEQLLDYIWDDVTTVLLPLAGRLAEVMSTSRRKLGRSSNGSPVSDAGGDNLGPLSQVLLESLSQSHFEVDQTSAHNPEGKRPTRVASAPRLSVVSRPSSVTDDFDQVMAPQIRQLGLTEDRFGQLEGLSSAIMIKGLSNPAIASRLPQPRTSLQHPAFARPVSGRPNSALRGGSRTLGMVRPGSASRRVGSAVTRHSLRGLEPSSIGRKPLERPKSSVVRPSSVHTSTGSRVGHKQALPPRPLGGVVLVGASAARDRRVGTPSRISTPQRDRDRERRVSGMSTIPASLAYEPTRSAKGSRSGLEDSRYNPAQQVLPPISGGASRNSRPQSGVAQGGVPRRRRSFVGASSGASTSTLGRRQDSSGSIGGR
eukprot:m.22797 g.22797  ORF g.22797 m.22797 type:complete len:571 (+) comp5860_c0_seq2:80-1792(+)